MSFYPWIAELAEADMGLFACGALMTVWLGAALLSIVIERAWLALRRLWKLWAERANGR